MGHQGTARALNAMPCSESTIRQWQHTTQDASNSRHRIHGYGNSVPSLHFPTNLQRLKYKVNYLKKQTQGKAMSIFTASQLGEELDNCLSGLHRAFGFLEVDCS